MTDSKTDIKNQVLGFAFVAFLLLGVLFGMNIMSFIFGNLTPANAGLEAGSEAFNTSLTIQNNSLGAIATYSNQASTQFNTLSIAITLIILLAVFAVFWVFFIGQKGGKGGAASGNFG